MGTDSKRRFDLNEIITGQNKALELVLQGAPLRQALEVLVKTVEKQAGPGVLASILLLDESGTRLKIGAAPSFPELYNRAIDGIEIGPFVGSCGRAAFLKEVVSVSDIATDPLWKSFKDLALRFNLRSCWSTPVVSAKGKVLGTFAIYRDQIGNPEPEDCKIVDLITRTTTLLIERESESGARQKTESLLELALSASRIGFWEYDFSNQKIILSDVMREDWGFDPYQEITQLSEALVLIHEEDVQSVLKAIEASKEKEVPYDISYRILKGAQKEVRWIWAKGQVLKDSHRKPTKLVGTSVDITAQKLAEKNLRESENQLIAYAEAMPQMAFIADQAGNIIYYNKRFYDFVGADLGQLHGWGWKEKQILHAEDLEKTNHIWNESLRTGNFYETEYRIRRFDGEYIWHMGRATPFRDEEGKIIRWYGTNTDIHEHKMELKQNEKLMETVLQSIDAGIVACDEKGHLTLFNRATTEFHGLPLQGIPSEKWAEFYDLFLPDGKTRMEVEDIPLFQALSGEKVKDAEMVIVPKNGPVRHISASGNALFDTQGKKIGAVVAMHDISDLKKAETNLREFNIALQAANHELEAFAYSVSHDLRAPLRGIDGFSKVLLEDYQDQLDENGRKYLNFVRDGVQRMGQLIDDLLKLSRLSRIEMRPNEVNLSDIAFKVVQSLKQMEPDRDLEVQIEPNLSAFGDSGLLTILMENLISNSWKFTGKKEHPVIEFGRLKDQLEPTFYIKDNGSGFDMAYKSKLFGAFQRLHTAKEFKGTGIGLATVRRVVHRHGGQVWAEAAPDQGATFFFTLKEGSHEQRH